MPDAALVLRRADQWTGPERVSQSPAGETVARVDGALVLASTAELVSEFQTAEMQYLQIGREKHSGMSSTLHTGWYSNPAATIAASLMQVPPSLPGNGCEPGWSFQFRM